MYRLLIFLFILSCAVYPNDPVDLLHSNKKTLTLEEKERQYPYFNIKVEDIFLDTRAIHASRPNPTPEQVVISKQLTIADKKAIFEMLDAIRFIINTPEFLEELNKQDLRFAREHKSTDGRISKINERADPNRVYTILQQFSYKIRVGKIPMDANAVAVGVVGKSTYYTPMNTFDTNMVTWIAFPKAHPFTYHHYWAAVTLHEIMHNLGYTHNYAALAGKKDVVQSVQNAFREVTFREDVMKKYQKQMTAFNGYYAQKYPELLAKDLKFKEFTTEPNVISSKPSTFSIPHVQSYNEKSMTILDGIPDDVMVCVLMEDGSHKMMTTKQARYLK